MSELNRISDGALDALFAQARAARPETTAAAYAFETRLMARLRDRHPHESMPLLGSLSWRLMPAFAVVVLGLALWHGKVAADASDAEPISCLQNTDAIVIGYGLN
jgi:hypothetical protein